MEIDHGPARLTLLSERAVFWKEQSILVLSDVHLGKSQAFRSQNIPLPEGHTEEDLTRMTALVKKTGTTHLIIAGDFIHSPTSHSPELSKAISSWSHRLPCQITLVSGNHDSRSGKLPGDWGIAEVPRLEVHGLEVVHEPNHSGDNPSICGHLHPVVLLQSRPRTPRLRLPCFWRNGQRLILPPFGSFTGGHPIDVTEGDSIFAITEDNVQAIPRKLILKKRT